jgi:hypothetical protein
MQRLPSCSEDAIVWDGAIPERSGVVGRDNDGRPGRPTLATWRRTARQAPISLRTMLGSLLPCPCHA